MKKGKLFAFLCVVLLSLGCVCLMASAETVASGTCGENVTWTLDDTGLLTISGTGDMRNFSYAADQPWASKRTGIVNVVVEEGVTGLSNRAFQDCSKLNTVSLPSTLTYLGSSAFNSCPMLYSVEIPMGVTKLNGYTFVGCRTLGYVLVPYTVTSMGANEFPTNGVVLKGYTHSYAEKVIAPYYKMNFVSIGSVPLEVLGSGNVTDTITWAVDNHANLTLSGEGELPVYSSPDEIPWAEYRSTIETVTLDEKIPALCNYIFYGCTMLDEINLPEHITHIPDYAFANCTKLAVAEIPKTVTSIGKGAFSGNTAMTEVKFHDNITSISDYAFENCTKLTSVKNIDNIVSIGEGAFTGCSTLTTITLPESVQNIGKSAFKNCSWLKTVNIPQGVEVIREYTFSGCDFLVIDKIPASVKSIEAYAFYSVNITENSFENIENITFIGEYALARTSITKFTFSDEITSISKGAFKECHSLTEINIPSNIKTVGNDAFNNCSRLVTVTVEDGVESFGDGVFYSCDALQSASFSDSVTAIGKNAFKECSALTSVKLPENIETIREATFEKCVLLNNVTIPASVKTIEDHAFYWCSALESIVVPDNVENLGESVFYNCDGLEKAVIGSGVYEILDCIFRVCDNLKDLEISYSVGFLHHEFFDDLPSDIVVKGYTGSITEFRCNKDGVTFETIGASPDGVVVDYGDAGDTASWRLETNGLFKVEGTGKATGIEATVRTNVRKYYTGYPKKLVVDHGINYVCGNEEFFSSVTDVTLPYTVLMSGLSMLPEGTTVRGYKNSYAERFAKAKGFTFVNLGEMPDEVVVEGTVDNISWTLTTYGKITLSGEGDLTELNLASDYPWYTYRTMIKELVVEDGVKEIPWEAFLSYDYQFEKATFACDATHHINSSYFTDDAVVYCYKYSAAHDSADKSNIKCEFTGIAPKYVVESGSAGESITWRYDNHRNLIFEGTGEMDSQWTPWSTYLSMTENIEVSEGITTIDSNAFRDSNITSIVIPNTVTYMANDIFYDCDKLEEITLSYSLVGINSDAFYQAYGIKTVRGYDGSYAETFANSRGCKFISLGEIPEKVEIEYELNENISYKADNYGTITFYGTGEIPNYSYDSVPWTSNLNCGTKRVVIEEGITRIGQYNFANGRYIEEIVLPESLVEIGANSLRNSLFEEVVIPENVNMLGYNSFAYCNELKHVKILGETAVIGETAFQGCKALDSVQIPKNTEFKKNAFLDSGISYIYYPGSYDDFQNCVTGVEYLPEGTTVLFEVTLPEESYLNVTHVTKSTKGANVSISGQIRGGEAAFIAGYDSEGTMVDIIRINPYEKKYSVEGDIATVKVFYWDGDKSMNPVNPVYVKEFN